MDETVTVWTPAEFVTISSRLPVAVSTSTVMQVPVVERAEFTDIARPAKLPDALLEDRQKFDVSLCRM